MKRFWVVMIGLVFLVTTTAFAQPPAVSSEKETTPVKKTAVTDVKVKEKKDVKKDDKKKKDSKKPKVVVR